MHLTDCDQCKKKNQQNLLTTYRYFFRKTRSRHTRMNHKDSIWLKIQFSINFFSYHPGCNHRYVVYGLALKQETHVSILSTTVSTIVSTSEPEFAISDSNKTSHADEQTTISKDIDSAVLVAAVFLIYLVFFIFAVMLYKMLKINSFWSFHLE